MIRHLRLWFWLRVMDACHCRSLFGGRIHQFALARAASNIDWSSP
jgi:hypothetical protein